MVSIVIVNFGVGIIAVHTIHRTPVIKAQTGVKNEILQNTGILYDRKLIVDKDTTVCRLSLRL